MLNNPFWLQLDGTPVSARPLAALRVLQRPISKAQLAGVQHLYGQFAAQMRLSVAPGQQWERFLPDGSRVLLRSHRGQDEVLVWPAGGSDDEHLWFFAPNIKSLTFEKSAKQGSVPRVGRRTRKLASLDGVLSSWEVVVGQGNVNQARLSPLARIERDAATGHTHVKAWAYDGQPTWRYLPGLVDKGRVYLGTYLHGKVNANTTAGQTITAGAAAPVVIPGARAKLLTPNTHLIALPGLPVPAQPQVPLVAPKGLRNQAIVYGASRMYDTLTNTVLGVGVHPYAPNLDQPLGKRALFTVECPITGSTPHPGLKPVSAGAVAGTTYTDQVQLTARRQNPAKVPKTHTLFAGPLSFVCQARTAGAFFARYVTFSPDGAKLCVAIHMFPSWEHASRAHALQDIRDSFGVVAAWEFTLAGGTLKDWPTCEVRQVVSPADHKKTTEVLHPSQVYFRETVYTGGSTTSTGYGPNDEYLNGQHRQYGTREHTFEDRMTGEGSAIVEQTPLLVEYGKDSVLKVITNRVTSESKVTSLVPFEVRPASAAFDCIVGGSWYVKPPEFVERYDFTRTERIERSILSNGAPVFSASLSRTIRKSAVTTFTASLATPPWVTATQFFDSIIPAAPLPSAEPFKSVPLGSNNTFIVLGMAGAGAGEQTRLMAVDRVLTALDALPKDSTGRYWFSWNPITDEFSTGEGTAWC